MIEQIVSFTMLLVGLGLLILLSGAETAAIVANRRLFREAESSGDRTAAKVLDLLGDLRRILGATLAGRLLALTVIALCLRNILAHIPALTAPLGPFALADLVALAAPALFALLGAEVAARGYFRRHADNAVVLLAHPLRLIAWALGSLAEGIQTVHRFLLKPLSAAGAERAYSRGEMAHIFGSAPAESESAAETEMAIVAASQSMIHNIVDLQRTRVREIMRPLIDVVAVRLGEIGIEGLKSLSRKTGYTKFPVFRERIIHLEGFVNVYDVLRTPPGDQSDLQQFVSGAHYVPEVMRVNNLLSEFLELRLTEVIVVDEYGACSGILTREDLLEEIVGDYEDEFDRRRPVLLIQQEGDQWICEGQVDIDDLNQALSTDFPKDGFETLGGWFCDALGRVPKTGDIATFGDFKLEVEEMDGMAIKKSRISKIDSTD